MSLLFSLVYSNGMQSVVADVTSISKTLRGWFFCLAFVSIGLDSNFVQLGRQMRGGKPLILYLVGQTLNLCLTLFMAWLMFEVVFPGAADVLQSE